MDTLEKIAMLLERRGLRQADLSRATGIRESRLTQLSQNDGKLRLPEALKIARTLGVTVDYLADPERDEPDPPLTEDQKLILANAKIMGEDVALKRLVNAPGPSIRGDKMTPAGKPPAEPHSIAAKEQSR